MKKILLFTIFTLISMTMFAQTTIKGNITDAETSEGLPGVTVVINSTTSGTATNFNGDFSFTTNVTGTKTITISFIGYKKITKEVNLNGGEVDLGSITLESSDIGLDEIEVVASYVESSRQTPVAVSTIKTAELEEKIGNQEFPEILKSTPGIYATKQGGGFGDARINVRGFDQTNVAVLINGIPVNDMENGRVFWSNWAGLSDATKAVQVQRGLGASKLAINSVGGTINIITRTTDAEKGGTISQAIGNNGYQKTMMTLSSGLMKGDWAVTVAGSRTTGDGYIDGTWIDAWSYFASIAKNFGANHQLVLTAIGAPQQHGQRTDNRFFPLSDDVYDNNISGNRYNPDWGYLDGQVLMERRNFYHKPQIALNHYWTVNDKISVNTSAYISFGRGGGTGTLTPTDFADVDNDGSTSDGVSFFTSRSDFRDSNGLVDWEVVRDWNLGNRTIGGKTNKQVTIDGEDYYLSGMILRASKNEHNWYGVLSTLTYELSDNLNLLAGIDGRYYKGLHYREVVNLLGGDAYYEDNDVNRQPGYLAQVGDKIDYDNDGLVNWLGAFAQLEYKTDQFSAFVTGSISNTGYKRVDRFNYLDSDEQQETDWQNFIGFNAKAGFGYNINENHNVYINGGVYSRAPIFDNVFEGFTNEIVDETVNEKVFAGELGYGLSTSTFALNLNGYYTRWVDRNFTRTVGQTTAIIEGQDALHMGVELDFVYRPTPRLSVTGMLSLGDWQWQNDVNARLVDENDVNNVTEVQIFADGLKVADAAQTTAALGIRYEFNPSFFVGVDYNFADNLYADYDPVDRTDENNRAQAWKIPSFHLFDLRAGYKFQIAGMNASVLANIQNLFDTEYVMEGVDGSDNNRATSRFFYGFGRTWTASFRLEF